MKVPIANLGDLKQLLILEARQRLEEGFYVDLAAVEKRIRDCDSLADVARVYSMLADAEPRGDFPYHEPSEWSEITKQRPRKPSVAKIPEEDLPDKVLGGWLGRCCGCMLGKPVEGWRHEEIVGRLRRIGEYPLKAPYLPPKLFDPSVSWVKTLVRGGISRVERDDDIDYTILNLIAYETWGEKVSTMDIARLWLEKLPYNLVYTAERAAYRNLVLGLVPPDTATFFNPFREWIGAQIRGDLWGYVSPGNPERASWHAYMDARLSHVKNGIYGEIYSASLVSLAFALDDAVKLVEAAASTIPARSRLAEAIDYTVSLYREGCEWEEAIKIIYSRYGGYSPVHTINNAAIVTAALLWGEGDFTRSIEYAVLGGLDTDCNGATVGSVVGVALGASRIPGDWYKPLNDTISSALSGVSEVKITGLSEKTLKLIRPEGYSGT